MAGTANRCDTSCWTDVMQQQKKIVAVSRGTLPKLKLISTSRNKGGNKNVPEMSMARYVIRAIFRATCVATKLQEELHEKLPGLTGLKAHHICLYFR